MYNCKNICYNCNRIIKRGVNMVKIIEIENNQIAMFNDENITEEEVIKLIEYGEYSSRVLMMSKRQYENIFKSKRSIIKETNI